MEARKHPPHRHPPIAAVAKLDAQQARDIAPAYRLAEDCLYEAGHAHQVARLALAIFDQLQPLHRLGSRRRLRLAAASLLHDIGRLEGAAGHHRTSLRYILESTLLPWSQRQRLIIGSIARYHRKSPPKPNHSHFVALSRADRQDVRILAGILRVADGLDASHRSLVRRVACSFSDRRITLSCITSRPADSELNAAIRKADLLTEVFDRDVQIEWRLASTLTPASAKAN